MHRTTQAGEVYTRSATSGARPAIESTADARASCRAYATRIQTAGVTATGVSPSSSIGAGAGAAGARALDTAAAGDDAERGQHTASGTSVVMPHVKNDNVHGHAVRTISTHAQRLRHARGHDAHRR
jgi:hypothetical protein